MGISRVAFVRNRDGFEGICVRLAELSSLMDFLSDYLLHQLAGSTHFSKIDLASTYRQLKITPESRDLTTLVTHDGLFRFRRMFRPSICTSRFPEDDFNPQILQGRTWLYRRHHCLW